MSWRPRAIGPLKGEIIWKFRFVGRQAASRNRLAVPGEVQELYSVRDDFRGLALGAVRGLVGANLQPAFDGDQATFREMIRHGFNKFAPRDDVNEIRFTLVW